MLLNFGSEEADAGMSQAIYQELDRLLSPPLQAVVGDPNAVQAALDGARTGWKKLSYAIAKGVIEHLMANMEIVGIQTRGNVNVPVSGNTNVVSGHQHSVSISGVQNNVVFTQSNDGTGHIR
jgi:hypothetical protein